MSDAALAPAAAGPASRSPRALPALYRSVWRWHFYAGLYVAPFLVMLALTGLVMLWTGVIEGRDGETRLAAAGVSAATVPVSAQAAAALDAVPGGTLVQYIAPLGPGRPALVHVDAGGEARMVAVDPHTGEALESWPRRSGLYDLASRIHGTLLIGTLGDRLIEIAAGFAVVLLVTGLYLWWPRGAGATRRMLVPDLRARGRGLVRSLHGTIGLYVSVLLLAFLVSGMAWTGFWGERYVQAWSTFPAEKWDNVPLSDATHASMNHGAAKEVPWALEQTPMPLSGSLAGSQGIAMGTPVDIDSVVAFAERAGFGTDGRFQVNAPGGETGVWTISQDSSSNDTARPTEDRTVHLDRFTGKVLADVRFADYSLGGKAMAVGIAFHEGDMGAWNVALNTLVCLSVIGLAVSGAVLWWMRRPGRALRLAAPPAPAAAPLGRGVVALVLLLSFLFPLVGLTLLAVLLADILVVSRIPRLRALLD